MNPSVRYDSSRRLAWSAAFAAILAFACAILPLRAAAADEGGTTTVQTRQLTDAELAAFRASLQAGSPAEQAARENASALSAQMWSEIGALEKRQADAALELRAEVARAVDAAAMNLAWTRLRDLKEQGTMDRLRIESRYARLAGDAARADAIDASLRRMSEEISAREGAKAKGASPLPALAPAAPVAPQAAPAGKDGGR